MKSAVCFFATHLGTCAIHDLVPRGWYVHKEREREMFVLLESILFIFIYYKYEVMISHFRQVWN